MTKQKQSLIISFLIGFAILAGLDQWTKGLAVQSLKVYSSSTIRRTGALHSG